jgi:hypothetical protein
MSHWSSRSGSSNADWHGFELRDSAPNYCGSRLDDAPPLTCARLEADNAAGRKNLHLVAAFDFRRQFVLNGTHAEYDRINALKLSQRSVRS